jgi:hypothetical protein
MNNPENKQSCVLKTKDVSPIKHTMLFIVKYILQGKSEIAAFNVGADFYKLGRQKTIQWDCANVYIGADEKI